MLPSLFLLLAALTRLSDADNLLFMQAVWSNGRRNPSRVCTNDSNMENTWKQGFGALNKLGMSDQFRLGECIYNEYAVSKAFLSRFYYSKEIYVRSSDDRSAITSAYSNMLGMYFDREAYKPNDDYPESSSWPRGFVPVPVHVTEPTTDFILNSGVSCPRYSSFIESLKQSAAYVTYETSVRTLLENVSAVCGESLGLLDLWVIKESLDAEVGENRSVLFDADMRENILSAYKKAETFRHGIGVEDNAGVDFKTEIAKLKGGNLLWNMIDHIDLKLKCMENSGSSDNECGWIKPLKYYAYSTDVTLLRSLMVVLGYDNLLNQTFEEVDFGSIIMELWNTSNESEVKLKFQRPLTNGSEGCYVMDLGSSTLEAFRSNSLPYKPGNILESCAVNSEQLRSFGEEKVAKKLTLPSQPHTAINESELLFVQAVWRHGDRSPLATFICENDPNVDSSWKQGFDELSYIGMKEHMILGSFIYNRYVTELNFLSKNYNSAETYIRSTDYNRTIISAISNLIGMYFNRTGLVAGEDFPSKSMVPRWPQGYVPIPIHMIIRADDYLADVSYNYCPRKIALREMAFNSEEIQMLVSGNRELLDNLSRICGRSMILSEIYKPVDTWLIEQIYNRTQLFDAEMYSKLKRLDNIAEDVKAGLLAYFPTVNGIDLSVELPRMRGGPLLTHLIDNIDLKLRCLNEQSEECRQMSSRKYYVYSSHDITLNGLFSALGCRERVVPVGIPDYSACVLFELWNTSSGYQIQVLYRRSVEETIFEDITGMISGCPAGRMCPLEVFKARSEIFRSDHPEQLCFDFSNISSTTTTTTPTTPGGNGASPTPFSIFASVLLAGVAFEILR